MRTTGLLQYGTTLYSVRLSTKPDLSSSTTAPHNINCCVENCGSEQLTMDFPSPCAQAGKCCMRSINSLDVNVLTNQVVCFDCKQPRRRAAFQTSPHTQMHCSSTRCQATKKITRNKQSKVLCLNIIMIQKALPTSRIRCR